MPYSAAGTILNCHFSDGNDAPDGKRQIGLDPGPS